jgi:hypothetical protein
MHPPMGYSELVDAIAKVVRFRAMQLEAHLFEPFDPGVALRELLPLAPVEEISKSVVCGRSSVVVLIEHYSCTRHLLFSEYHNFAMSSTRALACGSLGAPRLTDGETRSVRTHCADVLV